MKLTPFGFVNRAEIFVKEALTLPPKGGGEWSTRRTVNFVEHTGSLQILLHIGDDEPKAGAVLHSRLTGGPKDGGIQGWAEYPSTEAREAFVLRETDADRAMEEIFEIVEKTLSRIPEWDSSASFERPKPPPRALEPLIPEIQKPAVESAPVDTPAASSGEPPAVEAAAETPKEEPVSDMQAMVDSLLSPDNFDEPPAASEDPEPEPETEPEPPVEAAPEPVAEQAVEAPAEEETVKPAKKPGRGRKAKG